MKEYLFTSALGLLFSEGALRSPFLMYCVLQVGGFGARVREVRPLIADAAVHTIGEQAIPRESLTWHLGTVLRSEEKKFLALKHTHAVTFSADQDTFVFGLPEHLRTSSVHEAVEPSSETSVAVTSNQVAQVTFASMTSSLVMSQNMSSSNTEKNAVWRRIVPIICIAIVVGVIA